MDNPNEPLPIKSAKQLEIDAEKNTLLLDELEKSNAELKKQNAFIENIFNATLDHINVYDTNLNLISLNGVTERVMNMSKNDMIGKNFLEIFPGTAEEEYYEYMKKAARGETIINKVTDTPHGRYLEASYIPLYEKNSQYGVLVLSRDITEAIEKEAALIKLNKELQFNNEQLAKANAELEHFTHILSHDLQEPLRKIQIFSNIVAEKNSEAANNPIMKIQKSADRMKELIKNVLEYSKNGKSESIYETVNLNVIIEDVLSDLELTIADKNAVVNSSVLPEIKGIKYQIAQVFYNLISNAIKYCENVPCLQISHSTVRKKINDHDLNFIEISFKDNGIGFNEDYKKDIFVPFKRLQTKSDFEGTGIGLSLVQKIIDNHNGYVDVESKLGEGSIFKIGLPV